MLGMVAALQGVSLDVRATCPGPSKSSGGKGASRQQFPLLRLFRALPLLLQSIETLVKRGAAVSVTPSTSRGCCGPGKTNVMLRCLNAGPPAWLQESCVLAVDTLLPAWPLPSDVLAPGGPCMFQFPLYSGLVELRDEKCSRALWSVAKARSGTSAWQWKMLQISAEIIM